MNNSEHSAILSSVLGNARLGKWCPLEGVSVSLKKCPFYNDNGISQSLNAEHILLICP